MPLAIKKRTMFYIGLVILCIAIVFLAYVLYMGPHTRIPETQRKIIYNHPNGPTFNDLQPGDRLELNFESDAPVNVLLMHPEDKGKYFNTPVPTVQPIVLASESTGGYIDYTFNSSGTWQVLFENPDPPPDPEPTVKYWGQLIKQGDDYFYYYLKLGMAVVFILLGSAFLVSSRRRRSATS